MWNRIKNIWFKELTDSLRDKKALRQAIAMPVIIGIFYALLNPVLFSVIESNVEKQSAESVEITAVGSTNVDAGLDAMFTAAEIDLVEWDGSIEELRSQIQAGEIKSALVIPEGFDSALEGEDSAELEILINTGGSAFDIDTSTLRLRGTIDAYNQQIVAARLAERGIDMAILTPITVTEDRLTTPQQEAGQQAGFLLPILIAVVVVQGGMFVAIDVTAGEKERGTLESLLLTPTSDAEIFIGKLMAVFTTTLIPLILTFMAYGLVTNLLPESLGNGAKIPLIVIFGSVLIALPFVFLVNVALMVVAIRTKTFKDAQSAVTPITLLAMFPAMAAGFFPPTNPLLHLIPAYGTGAVAGKLAVEGIIPWLPFGITALSCIVLGLIGIAIGLRMFNRERLLYSM